MLQKRIDLGSIPYGLAIAGEDLVKGSAVVVKNVGGILKAFYPTTEAEAHAVRGFVTFRIEEVGKADKDFDTLKAGQRIVVYTLVNNNQWGTTQFSGTVAEHDELVVDFDTAKGTLRKKTAGEVTASRPTQFYLYRLYSAGECYTDPMVDVDVRI